MTLGFPGMPLWEELATLVTIMLLGHWLEMRSISQAQGALGEIAKLLPSTALRVTAKVRPNVSKRCRYRSSARATSCSSGPGAAFRPTASCARGERRERGDVTGESAPVEKNEGAKVIAGTVNGAGSLRVEVTGTGDRTALAGIMRLVEQAQSSRSRAQALADRAAFWLTWIALGAGVVTLAAWLAHRRERRYGDRAARHGARHRLPTRARASPYRSC